MKIKKEYIALAVIIATLSFYLVSKNTDRTHYQLPEVQAPAGEDISKLVFSTSGGTIILERFDDVWMIEPEGYRADKSPVGRMIDAITGFSITTLVAESENYAIYDLEDDKRIKLEVYSRADVVLAFDIGKVASTRRHTFVRLEGAPGVYQATGNLRNVFETDMDRLRDKAVLTFNSDEITNIEIMSEKGSLRLVKIEETAISISSGDDEGIPAPLALRWQTEDGIVLDDGAVTRMISVLAALKCDTFIDGRKKEDFSVPLYTVMIRGTEVETLSIFGMVDDKYPAISSQSEFPFLLPGWRADQIMKELEDLAEKDPAKPTPQVHP